MRPSILSNDLIDRSYMFAVDSMFLQCSTAMSANCDDVQCEVVLRQPICIILAVKRAFNLVSCIDTLQWLI